MMEAPKMRENENISNSDLRPMIISTYVYKYASYSSARVFQFPLKRCNGTFYSLSRTLKTHICSVCLPQPRMFRKGTVYEKGE